jgi:hypothetical protein
MEDASWLSLTPELERELPPILAALRGGRSATAVDVSRERKRAATVVVRGRQRDWLAYIGEAVRLTCGAGAGALGGEQRALALEVLANHHRLLLGLPGDAAEDTATERAQLERALGELSTTNPERNGGA